MIVSKIDRHEEIIQFVEYYLYSTIWGCILFLWFNYGANTICEEDVNMKMEFISYIKSYWAFVVTFLLQSKNIEQNF